MLALAGLVRPCLSSSYHQKRENCARAYMPQGFEDPAEARVSFDWSARAPNDLQIDGVCDLVASADRWCPVQLGMRSGGGCFACEVELLTGIYVGLKRWHLKASVMLGLESFIHVGLLAWLRKEAKASNSRNSWEPVSSNLCMTKVHITVPVSETPS